MKKYILLLLVILLIGCSKNKNIENINVIEPKQDLSFEYADEVFLYD